MRDKATRKKTKGHDDSRSYLSRWSVSYPQSPLFRWLLPGLISLLTIGSMLACARTRPTPEAPVASVLPSATAIAASPRTGSWPTPTPAPYVHIIEPGETLDYIAATLGCTTEALTETNDIDDARSLQIGQRLIIPSMDLPTGPDTPLLPDSEFVYGPAYLDFDVEAFCATRPGYLNSYEEVVDGELLSGPEIVELIARRYSVGPRLLLAMIEFQSGWVDNPAPSAWALEHPLGETEALQGTLLYHLAWAADELNWGYYDWKGRGREVIRLAGGKEAQYAPAINAATASVQRYLAYDATWDQWQTLCGEGSDSFIATYEGLFGDPFSRDLDPVVPPDLDLLQLRLPWKRGHTWYLTGGPHGGWNDGSAWAALDFVPPGRVGCQTATDEWLVAAASGVVSRRETGLVVQDLDEDGREETGWNLMYMHVATEAPLPVGTFLEEGEPLGFASCEGGYSTASHLHFARKYNGEWIPADGTHTMILSGWRARAAEQSYEGIMTKGREVRSACECYEDKINGLTAE
jgi:LasA protease